MDSCFFQPPQWLELIQKAFLEDGDECMCVCMCVFSRMSFADHNRWEGKQWRMKPTMINLAFTESTVFFLYSSHVQVWFDVFVFLELMLIHRYFQFKPDNIGNKHPLKGACLYLCCIHLFKTTGCHILFFFIFFLHLLLRPLCVFAPS